MENETAAAANQNPTGPMLAVQSVYLKDCSYEAPKGPRIEGNWSPQISLDINTSTNVVAPDVHEVVLQINLEAKSGDRTVWLLELQQAGAFMIRNLPQADLSQVLTIMAPNYLLGFARAAISDLVIRGGFPPFLLPLVTFEALAARRAQEQQAAATATPSQMVN